MSIKPWQEREASDDWVPADQQTAMQSEIDELRAAAWGYAIRHAKESK